MKHLSNNIKNIIIQFAIDSQKSWLYSFGTVCTLLVFSTQESNNVETIYIKLFFSVFQLQLMSIKYKPFRMLLSLQHYIINEYLTEGNLSASQYTLESFYFFFFCKLTLKSRYLNTFDFNGRT